MGSRRNLGVPSVRFASLLRIVAVFSIFSTLAPPSGASEINSCKYLQIIDFTSDPYGIASELRRQATARGFMLVPAVAQLSQVDVLKACVMSGSWTRTQSGGRADLHVSDAAGGELITEASAGVTAWWGASQAVRALVGKIYDQLGYTGYSEAVYQRRMQREFPPRPKIAITEDQIRKSEPKNHIEGIWNELQNQYRLGILEAPKGSGADFVAVVLQSNIPLWEAGEIKAEFRSTASPDVFTSTYFIGSKKPVGTTFFIDHEVTLHGTVQTPQGPLEMNFVRVWPTVATESGRAAPVRGGVSGTGFLLNRNGLIATNWHVVADAKNIGVAFPGWKGSVSAEVILKDSANDLAILRMSDATKIAATCPEFPFQLAPTNVVTLGERVSAIGYPLPSLLGSNPKFSEGVISSKSGLQDDPRTLQITAEVQPGSSGSPLFDRDGNVLGVVVATLDAGKLYQMASAIPQNVNWAIKSSYLVNLLSMLPNESPASRTTPFSPDKAAGCVAIITAW